jgi:lipoprotein-releasing system permease protein
MIGLEQAQMLFGRMDAGEISQLEVKLKRGVRDNPGAVEGVTLEIKNVLKCPGGPVYLHPRVYQAPSFDVKNQQEQHPLMYKMFNTEKWISFAILSFVLLLISFNLVGALTLLVMDKRRDFVLFRNLGMEKSAISWVVFWEGIWVSVWGTAVGLMMGVGLVLLQQKTSWVSTQGTFSIPYPVELRPEDLLLVLGLNTALGVLSAVVPAWRAGKLSGELSSVRQ